MRESEVQAPFSPRAEFGTHVLLCWWDVGQGNKPRSAGVLLFACDPLPGCCVVFRWGNWRLEETKIESKPALSLSCEAPRIPIYLRVHVFFFCMMKNGDPLCIMPSPACRLAFVFAFFPFFLKADRCLFPRCLVRSSCSPPDAG